MRNRLMAGILALGLVAAISYIARPTVASSRGTDTPSSATAVERQPGVTNATELDRLIEVFATRAPERAESLEFQTLGDLYLDRAILSASIDDYVAATSAFEAALEIAPRNIESQVGLAAAALATHDFGLARQVATAVADADPSAVEALAIAGDAALASGDLTAAAVHYDALAAALPGHPAVLLRLADLAAESGEADLAADLVDRAIATAALDLGPSSVAPYEAYAANQAFLGGDYETALGHSRRAVSADPDYAAAVSVLGDVLAATGDLEAARDAYRTAVLLAPNPGDYIAIGNLEQLLGDDDAAANAFLEAERLIVASDASRRAHARTWANYLLDHEGDFALALAVAEGELETRTDTAGWETYAWALYRTGDLAGARRAIDVALERGLDAHGYYRAGAISAALGENDRAIVELTTALDLSPRFHPIDATHAAALLSELGEGP